VNTDDSESDDENEPHSQPPDTTKMVYTRYSVQLPDQGNLENRFWFKKVVFPFLAVVSEPMGEERERSGPETIVEKALQPLLSQEALRQDAGETTEWEAGPLHWLLYHRGNQWNVSAGYYEGNDTPDCELVSRSRLLFYMRY
jgi:hypothetical protein